MPPPLLGRCDVFLKLKMAAQFSRVAVRKTCVTDDNSSASPPPPLRIYSELNLERNRLRLDQCDYGWSQITQTCTTLSKSTATQIGLQV